MKNNKEYLTEAVRIGEELISLAEKDKSGFSWKTMNFNENQSISWIKSPYIYDGVSGIALFFIELYKKTGIKKYIKIAHKALSWTENYFLQNPNNNFAFYSGKAGVAFCFVKMFETTQDKKYLEKSLKILHGTEKYIDTNPPREFINGAAGSLLGLLHVYDAIRKKWILDEITKLIKYILSRAQHGPVGLYWDRSSYNIRGLCGFSHGAAGVGFVFQELGRYFDNKAFYWISDQAFAYEDNFFNNKEVNWPDFRKGTYLETDLRRHIQAYQDKNWRFFEQEAYMNAWCHGAPGISLARLRAYEIFKNKKYINLTLKFLNDYEPAHDLHSFTLCHGVGGNMEPFLQAYTLLKNPHYLSSVQEIADRILLAKKKGFKYISGYGRYSDNDEDYSLLNGNAGIGLFLLRVIDPIRSSSVLFPILKNEERVSYKNFSLPKVKEKIVSDTFPATLKFLKSKFPKKISRLFTRTDHFQKSIIKSFTDLADRLIIPENPDYINELYLLEKKKTDMKNKVKNDALYYMKVYFQKGKIANLLNKPDSKFFNTLLQFDTSHSLHDLNWKRENGGFIRAPTFYLLKFNYDKIEQIEISKFCFIIFSILLQPHTAKEMIDIFIKTYLQNKSEEVSKISNLIISQIREGLHSGVINQIE